MKSFVILHNEGRYYYQTLQSEILSDKLQEIYSIETSERILEKGAVS